MALTISLGAVALVAIALYIGYRIGHGSETRELEREYRRYERAVNQALIREGQEPLKPL